MAEAYARQHHLELDQSYRDEGLSAHRGKTVTKGAFGRFVKAVTDEKIPAGSFLLVEAFDRFSRQDVLSALAHLTTLLHHDVTVVTLEDNQVYSLEKVEAGTAQIIVAVVKMQAAYEFSKRLATRLKSVWRSKRDNAGIKKLTRTCPQWLKLNPATGEFVEIDERADVVREIFDLYCQGAGKERIARILNERGVATWEHPGKRAQAVQWHSGYISRILKNRAVLGEFQAKITVEEKNKDGVDVRRDRPVGDIHHGYYPMTIERQVWDRSIAVRNRRPATGGPRQNINNLFTGLVDCKHCGSSAIMRSKGDRRAGAIHRSNTFTGWRAGHYLVCSAAWGRLRDKKTGDLVCNVREMVELPPIEDAILNHLETVLLDPNKQKTSVRIKQLEAEIGRLNDDIGRRRIALDEALVQFAGRPEILASVARIEASIEADRVRLTELATDLSATRGAVTSNDSLAAIAKLRKDAASDDVGIRRKARLRLSEALRSIVDYISIEADTGTTYVGWGGRIGVGFITGGELIPIRVPLPENWGTESDFDHMRAMFLRAEREKFTDENGEEQVRYYFP
jgi:DNA invertase Pin-like site-specific DNA recombinase